MLEAAAVAASFLAFAAFHAAEPRRRPARWRGAAPPWLATALRVAGAAVLASSVALWRSVEGATSALLVVAAALCAAATLFVLVAPVFPRLVWGLTVACAAATLVLSIAGGLRG
jgi:hypothetical protein